MQPIGVAQPGLGTAPVAGLDGAENLPSRYRIVWASARRHPLLVVMLVVAMAATFGIVWGIVQAITWRP